jgi:hypothetical protein
MSMGLGASAATAALMQQQAAMQASQSVDDFMVFSLEAAASMVVAVA